jgi:hypothetical protein
MMTEIMLDFFHLQRQNDRMMQSQIRAACMVAYLQDFIKEQVPPDRNIEFIAESLEEILKILNVRVIDE